MRTRFAPSPTGPLHLGHAYSAMLAQDMAVANGGEFLLRIEDIDRQRSRAKWEQCIYEDLAWLGMSWPPPVMRQSERSGVYARAIRQLWDRGLLYPCNCTRRDIADAMTAPQEGDAPLIGPDGAIYPGTCRPDPGVEFPSSLPIPENQALRLNIRRTILQIANKTSNTVSLEFLETGAGPQGQTGQIKFQLSELPDRIGDIVLARRDVATSYHLSAVLDDAAQGISHVVRGADLFDATTIHVLLQQLLNLPTPIYHHHRLIRDDAGKRLAKRDDARAISKFRSQGATPDDIRVMVGL